MRFRFECPVFSAAWILAFSLATSSLLGASKPVCEMLPLHAGVLQGEAAERTPGPLRVVSLNMHGEGRLDVLWDAVKTRPELKDADVFLLQEFIPEDIADFERSANPAGYIFSYARNPDLQEARAGGQGLGILSRFPLQESKVLQLPQYDIGFNNRCRIAISTRAATPWGEVAIYTLHLDTRINAGQRVRQFRPVLKAAVSSGLPALIGGDFNSVDMLWIGGVVPIPWLQWQKRAIRKEMESEGFTTPFTKTGHTFNRFPFKLDWIYQKGLETVDSGLVKLDFTDHKALWITLDPSP